jgi:hypothetical protein
VATADARQVHAGVDQPDLGVVEVGAIEERLVQVHGRAQEHEHHRRVADDPGQPTAGADLGDRGAHVSQPRSPRQHRAAIGPRHRRAIVAHRRRGREGRDRHRGGHQVRQAQIDHRQPTTGGVGHRAAGLVPGRGRALAPPVLVGGAVAGQQIEQVGRVGARAQRHRHRGQHLGDQEGREAVGVERGQARRRHDQRAGHHRGPTAQAIGEGSGRDLDDDHHRAVDAAEDHHVAEAEPTRQHVGHEDRHPQVRGRQQAKQVEQPEVAGH